MKKRPLTEQAEHAQLTFIACLPSRMPYFRDLLGAIHFVTIVEYCSLSIQTFTHNYIVITDSDAGNNCE